MPIANVIQGQTKPLTGWKHVLSKVGEGLGQGLESGMVQGANLSLQDKMQTLQDERAYAQQEKLLALKQKQNEAIVRSQADKFRKMGGEFVPFADAYEAAGGNAQLAKMFVDYGMLGSQNTSQMPSGMQNVEALGPTRQQMMAKNMLMPIENQEALPEQQEMAPVQQSSIQQPNRPYDQQITATSQLPSLDDYARKMSPQYDRLPEGSPVKAKILNQAKIRRDADVSTQQNILRQQKEKREIQKSQQPFVKEIRAKSDAAKNILNAAENMAKIRERGNLGVTSGVRGAFSPQTRAAKAAYDTQASQFLSYYKALFPRGFTQSEFKHIEENWMPSSSNTDERNKAIEESFKEMANSLVQKAQILDDLRDENGNLPENAEQKVDQLMGEKLKKLQSKLTEEIPAENKQQSSGFNELPSASQYSGKMISDTKTGNTFRSNGTKWVKVK